MRTRIIALFVAVMVGLIFSSCEKRSGEIGSKSNPIKFYFMPLKSPEVFSKNSEIIKNYLEGNTGLSIKPVLAPDFLSIIKAFSNNQADIAFMNTLGFLMARDMTKAEAHLMFVYGDVFKTYRGEFVARVDGPINSPTDLAGKKIVFADPFSASGYLYALKYLKDHNIKPAQTIFTDSHKKAVEMVYKGEADAAATYHSRPTSLGAERDARAELLSQYPDMLEKIKIVALTDEIPNGPIAFAATLPAQTKSKLVGALVEFARSEQGRKALGDLYNMTGFAIASDLDYNIVSDVIKKLGKTVEETVPGGITFYNTKVVGSVLEN